MKALKKSPGKPSVKGKGTDTDNSKKQKLKPLNPKEFKNWKNKLEDDDDDLNLNEDGLDEHGAAFEGNLEEDDDHY